MNQSQAGQIKEGFLHYSRFGRLPNSRGPRPSSRLSGSGRTRFGCDANNAEWYVALRVRELAVEDDVRKWSEEMCVRATKARRESNEGYRRRGT